MQRARLREGLLALGLALPEEAVQRLLDYLALIAKWNRIYNLTGVDEPERMVSLHLLDSLAALPVLEEMLPRLERLADVGSGAGLPGIPLALARPQWEVALVEASHKKASFLRQAALELGLARVRVVGERVEDWRPEPRFDAVISRAFSDLGDFVRAAGHLCAPHGRLVAMKGAHPHQEVAQLPAGFAVERVTKVSVPGLAARRHLIIMKTA